VYRSNLSHTSCRVFLSQLGWSTNLELRLTGAMKAKELISIMRALRNERVFHLAGQSAAVNSSEIFKLYGDKLASHVYKYGGVANSTKTVSKWMVASIAPFTGPKPHLPYRKTGARRLDAADRAMFLGIMKGEELGIQEVIARESSKDNGKPFFVTCYKYETDFALTRIEKCSLVCLLGLAWAGTSGQMMTDEQHVRKKLLKQLWCKTSNTRFSIMMTISLRNDERPKKPTCDGEDDNPLKRIGQSYKESYTKSLFLNYSGSSEGSLSGYLKPENVERNPCP